MQKQTDIRVLRPVRNSIAKSESNLSKISESKYETDGII